MGKLRSDSPICRRIVLAFLDFIQSIELEPGVDHEGLDVARECLEEAFKLNHFPTDYRMPPGVLVDIFSRADGINDLNSDPVTTTVLPSASTTSPTPKSADPPVSEALKSRECHGDLHAQEMTGISKDELFGKFYVALDKINFFAPTPGGEEDHVQLTKSTNFFEDALLEMEKLGSQILTCANLAETFKSQGNRNMQSKLYAEAIDLYTCAIALSDNNAIYYCNRAAAYTQIHKYNEAIADCRKSIEIDPNYAKAYSRQGLVLYALGKYKEAVVIFHKALQLDPNNESVRENIQVAQQKWIEEQRQEQNDLQNSGSGHSHQGRQQSPMGSGFQIPINLSNIAETVMNMAPGAGSSYTQEQDPQSAGSGNNGGQFTSMPNNSSVPPIDFSQILGMVSGALGSQQGPPARPPGATTTTTTTTDGSSEQNARMDSGLNVNISELPQELSGVFGSVIDMLTSQNNNGQQQNGRSP